MGDDDYDDFSKELNQYRKSKDRGRGEFCLTNRCGGNALYYVGVFFISNFFFLLQVRKVDEVAGEGKEVEE